MKRFHVLLASLFVCMAAQGAIAGERRLLQIDVERFVTLPADVRHPEGITADPRTGDIYVGTFDARQPEASRSNQLLRYSRDGRLISQKSFGPTPLTGLAFAGGKVYLLNFGASSLQRIEANFDAATRVEQVAVFKSLEPPAPLPRSIQNPDGSQDELRFGSGGVPAPNGMVFDRGGNLYVSDSFQGAIYRISRADRCAPCAVETISRDPLLATGGALPFGANGLALSADERALYILNAGDGRLLRMGLPRGPVSVIAESLHGADGLMRHGGRLWVAANQADRVLGLDEYGRIVAEAGRFDGIDRDGAPIGLLFPASTVVQGEWMIVTNLALPLTDRTGDEWEEQVTRWTLARFKLPEAVPQPLASGKPIKETER